MLSISQNVRLFVCVSVCLSVCSPLRYRLTVFLPPLPEVGCPIFLEIRNPWGKVMERSGLTFEHFCLEVVSNRRAKKLQRYDSCDNQNVAFCAKLRQRYRYDNCKSKKMLCRVKTGEGDT